MSTANIKRISEATRLVTLIIVLTIVLISTRNAVADGCMIPNWGHEIWETHQYAYLDYDHKSQQEDLYILPRFLGSTSEFVWIVPTPALPEITEASASLFRNLGDMSRPVIKHRTDSFDCLDGSNLAYAPGDAQGTEIIETQVVGIYSTYTIASNDVASLTDSLTVWGFLGEDNTVGITETLAHYVNKGWYFVAMKITESSFPEEGENYSYADYWYGSLQPIHLSFQSDQPIYPLRISALSAPVDAKIVLYVNERHRVDWDSAETTYANRITPQELKVIEGRFQGIFPTLKAGDFLTKFEATMSAEDMADDLILEQAENNHEILRLRYSGFGGSTTLLLLFLLIAIGRPWRLLRKLS